MDETRAKWVQVYEHLLSQPRTPGGRVPSVITLSGEYNVAQATAQKALRKLREDGLTRTEPGLGSFWVD